MNNKFNVTHGILFRIFVVVFLSSLLIDTGENKLFGIPIPMLTLYLLFFVVLHNWTPIKDKIIWGAVGMIILWVCCQWVVFDYYLDGLRMISLLAGALIIGGQGANFKDISFHFNVMFMVLFMVSLSFYIGLFWHPVPTGNSFGGFNPNSVALMLNGAVVIGFGLFFTTTGYGKKAVAIALCSFPWVIWNTGSRKAVALLFLLCFLQIFFRIRRKKLLVVVFLIVAIISAPGVKKYYFTTSHHEANLVTKFFRNSEIFQNRYTSKLYGSANFRMQLIERGWEVFTRKPFLGYGIGAPSSPQWLENNIGIQDNGGRYVMVHNGFIDYLLMGGIPLFLVFMVLFGNVSWRLFKLVQSNSETLREYAFTMLLLTFLFVYNIFFGDYSWKMGWWIIGCGILMIRISTKKGQDDFSFSPCKVSGAPLQ